MTTITPSVVSPMNLRSSGRNTLVNALQKRRHILVRDRPFIEEQNISIFNNKYFSNSVNTSRRNKRLRNSITTNLSFINSSSITNNSIFEPSREYLQMDESVHQTYNMSAGSAMLMAQSDPPTSTPSITKESRSYVNINRRSNRNQISNTTIGLTTIKTTRLYYDVRQKHNRGKMRFMPQKSSYDSELIQFAIYGQKRPSTPKSQLPSVQNKKISRKRGSPHKDAKDNDNDVQIHNDKLEILDVSLPPRISSTEKTKMIQAKLSQVTKNVAYNNLVRRQPVYSENMKGHPSLQIIRATTLKPQIITMSTNTGLNPVNNDIEGSVEPKELYLRSVNANESDFTTDNNVTTVSNQESETLSQRVPGLIISIPDDATPEERESQLVHFTSTELYNTKRSSPTSLEIKPEIVTTISVIEEVTTRSTSRTTTATTETERSTLPPLKLSSTSSYRTTNYMSTKSTPRYSFVTTELVPSQTYNRIHLSYSDNPTNNDVKIEIDKINVVTYVMIALALIPVAAIILYAIRIILSNHDNKNNPDMLDKKPISPVVKLESDKGSNFSDESMLRDDSFSLNRNHLRFKSLLGEGNFGQVWKAEIDDVKGHLQGTMRIVAVKTERKDNGQGGLKAEAQIMKKLGLSHQNVVKFLGACIEQGKILKIY